MTDEARRIYYSPGHWEKMREYQLIYIEALRSRKYDCCNSRALLRHSFLMGSAYGRLDYFQINFNVMVGYSVYKWKREASLLVNGINYGLMLEGLRQKLHADIDNNFEKTFRFVELKNAILDTARAMREFTGGFKIPDELFHIQRTGRAFRNGLPFPANIVHDSLDAVRYATLDMGSPAGDKAVVTIFDEWPVYREYKKPTTPAPDDEEEEDDLGTAVYNFRKAHGYYDKWYTKLFDWLRSLTPWT